MTRDELIEKAAQALHLVRHAPRCRANASAEDFRGARALANEGLLADPDRVISLTAYRELATGYKGQTARADELQVQLDAVRAVLEREWPDSEAHHDFVNQQVEDARAALQGDRPAKEADRG